MKRLLTFLPAFFLIVFTANGQTVQKIRKVVQVLPQQTFYLNGGMRASFGGKSRSFYKIDLPQNTVEWYYIISTAEGKLPSTAALNLVPQLTNLFDPTGITGLAVSAIVSPTGSKSCDIYLTDRKNADAFMEKVDNNGGKFYYTISGSRQNFRNGTVQIKDAVSGTCYLGFKNPSESTGITIAFEVAAIVEETVVDKSIWTPENKDRFYALFYQDLKRKKTDEAIAKELATCVMTKMCEQKTPAEYDQMAKREKEDFIAKLYSNCSEKYQEQRTPTQTKAINYGNLGWHSFESGDIAKCIDYSNKALSLDSTLGYVKANLGLCHLINGDESKATEYYIEALSDITSMKMSSQIKQQITAVVDDINNAAKKYPGMKNGNDIKTLFLQALKNY